MEYQIIKTMSDQVLMNYICIAVIGFVIGVAAACLMAWLVDREENKKVEKNVDFSSKM